MSIEYRGTPAPLRQRLTERFSPTRGFTAEYEYKGFDAHKIRNLAARYAQAGYEYEFTDEQGIHTLVATVPDGGAGNLSVRVDTWEIAVSQQSPSVFRHPWVQQVQDAGISDDIAAGIKQAMENSETTVAEIVGKGYFNSLNAGDLAWLIRLLERARIGHDSYMDWKYVLRHTTNVSSRYSANISDVGIGYNYNTAQLLTEAGDPNLWIYPLPGRLAFKIEEIAFDYFARWDVAEIQDHYQVGWLKTASSEGTAADGRVNIVTEYHFDRWTLDLYPPF